MHSPSVAESELLGLLQRDPEQGIRVVHQRYGRQILRYLKRLRWHSLAAEDLQEIYQDTLLGFWRHLQDRGEPPLDLVSFLLRLARRRAVDHLRLRLTALREQPAEVLDAVFVDPGPSPSDHLKHDDLQRAILAILDTLPPRQSLVVRLVVEHVEERLARNQHGPVAEALSALTGQPEKVEAVRSLWRNARDHLATELRRRGFALDGLPLEP